jgi:hypothetical protein
MVEERFAAKTLTEDTLTVYRSNFSFTVSFQNQISKALIFSGTNLFA